MVYLGGPLYDDYERYINKHIDHLFKTCEFHFNIFQHSLNTTWFATIKNDSLQKNITTKNQ